MVGFGLAGKAGRGLFWRVEFWTGTAGKVSSVSVCYGLMRYGWILWKGGEKYGV